MLGKMYSNNNAYRVFLRRMVRGGFRFQDKKMAVTDMSLVHSTQYLRLHEICGISDLSSFIKSQHRNYAMHVIRMSWERSIKSLMFNDDKYVLRGTQSDSK